MTWPLLVGALTMFKTSISTILSSIGLPDDHSWSKVCLTQYGRICILFLSDSKVYKSNFNSRLACNYNGRLRGLAQLTKQKPIWVWSPARVIKITVGKRASHTSKQAAVRQGQRLLLLGYPLVSLHCTSAKIPIKICTILTKLTRYKTRARCPCVSSEHDNIL